MKWTPRRYAVLRRLIAEGYTYAEIAARWKCSRSVIAGGVFRTRRWTTGLNPKRKPGPAPGTAKVSWGWARVTCRAPYEPDSSVPDFANDDDHVAAVMAHGGYPVLHARR